MIMIVCTAKNKSKQFKIYEHFGSNMYYLCFTTWLYTAASVQCYEHDYSVVVVHSLFLIAAHKAICRCCTC